MDPTGGYTDLNGAFSSWKANLLGHMFSTVLKGVQYRAIKLRIGKERRIGLSDQLMQRVARYLFCRRVHGGNVALPVDGDHAICGIFNDQIVKGFGFP